MGPFERIGRTIDSNLDAVIVIAIVCIIFVGGVCLGYSFAKHKIIKQDELIEWRTHHAAILEDVIDDIYENDREYFDENIATSEHFDSLRSLYRDEFKRDPKTITWDDMYNY